jgi:putative phosphoribosyl transferase
MLFQNRFHAGQVLAEEVDHYRDRSYVLVIALPRGGVPVAFEVARALRAPLDVFVVRKVGLPGQEELAIGAIASGGITVINHETIDELHIPEQEVRRLAAQELIELKRRESEYRGNRPAPTVNDRVVILVDDGLATGSTMRAAVAALRQRRAKRLVVAVPVAAATTCNEFRDEVDEMICAKTPSPFFAVGMWYDDFEQITDDEVKRLLAEASQWTKQPALQLH